MMSVELLSVISSIVTAVVGGIVGWFTAKRQKDNVYLQEQLSSVNLLLENNKAIMAHYTQNQEKMLALTDENARLKETIRNLEGEMTRLRRKNEENKRKIEEMQRKLDALFSTDEK